MDFKKLSTEEIEKKTAAEQKEYFKQLVAHEKEQMIEAIIKTLDEKLKNQEKGFLTKEEADKIKTDITALVKGLKPEDLEGYKKTIEDLKTEVKTATQVADEIKKIAKKQGETIKKLKEGYSIPDVRRKVNRQTQIETLIKHAVLSQEFEALKEKGFSGITSKMSLGQDDDANVCLKVYSEKGNGNVIGKTVGVANDHTGDVAISSLQNIVRDDTPLRMHHVRDLLNVSMTDRTQIVAGQVYNYSDALTLGAMLLAENQTPLELTWKTKELTWGVKRIATTTRISKNYLNNGTQWLIDYLISKLPEAVLSKEDDQLLDGDGVGTNILGLKADALAFNLDLKTYAAGAIASVATYNSGDQTLVTFAANHDAREGDKLVIANATHAGYNGTHKSIEVLSAKTLVIDVSYVAESSTAAWTGSLNSPFYKEIDSANEHDVLAATAAELTSTHFMCEGHVINTKQLTKLALLKNTDADLLNIKKDDMGRITHICGVPVIATTAMPYNTFLSGDFSMRGAELKEYTPLNIQFVQGEQAARDNDLLVVVEEQIIFPIYNPKGFVSGKFSTAITQMTA